MFDLQETIGRQNAANGWHKRFHDLDAGSDTERDHVVSKIMLIVTELAEAVEELRDGRGITETYERDGKPEGFPVELADAVIRALDLAYMTGIDLEQVIKWKLDFNAGRGSMHGGKKL